LRGSLAAVAVAAARRAAPTGKSSGNNAGAFDGFTASGDATIDTTTGAVTIAADAVALGSDTTGSYAAGDAEAGAALTGDSATSFFSSGTLEAARLPAATTSAQGACELATEAETETGTDPDRCVTPAGVAAAIAATPTNSYVLLDTLSLNGNSSFEITDISSEYRQLVLELEDVSTSVNNAAFRVAVSTTNGSAFGSTANVLPTISSSATVSGVINLPGLQIQRTTSHRIYAIPYASNVAASTYLTPVLVTPDRRHTRQHRCHSSFC
jgi:hypothetical protein